MILQIESKLCSTRHLLILNSLIAKTVINTKQILCLESHYSEEKKRVGIESRALVIRFVWRAQQ